MPTLDPTALDALAARVPGRTIGVVPPDRLFLRGWFTLGELDELTALVAELLDLSPHQVFLTSPSRGEGR